MSSAEIDLVGTSQLERFIASDNGLIEGRLMAGVDMTVDFQYFAVPEPLGWSPAGVAMLAAALLVNLTRGKLVRAFGKS